MNKMGSLSSSMLLAVQRARREIIIICSAKGGCQRGTASQHPFTFFYSWVLIKGQVLTFSRRTSIRIAFIKMETLFKRVNSDEYS